jgi:hypothetical protein|tara:strand:+ start:125 stop:295 length:171 start_codon:yes stop_codon:yes gene_type:complete
MATVIQIVLCLLGSEVTVFNGYTNGMVYHCFGAGEVFIHMHSSVKGAAILGRGLVG